MPGRRVPACGRAALGAGWVVAVAALVGPPVAAGAATNAAVRLAAAVAPATSRACTLDGQATPGLWDAAVVGDGFVDLTRRAASALPTRARVAFTADAVCALIEVGQPGVPVTATQATDDVGFGQDDFVGIGLDTNANGQAYFFEVTPRGVKYQQARESIRFRPHWSAAVQPSSTGWSALLVVPYGALRVPASAEQHWRVNVVRRVAALNDNLTWAYDAQMDDGTTTSGTWPTFADTRYWPTVTYRAGAAAPRRSAGASLYGVASAGRDYDRFQQASGAFTHVVPRQFGIDVSAPVGPTIALSATANPDFSNVEIDQQSIAPLEFPRNLTEYRPFFAQGAAYFDPIVLPSVLEPANRLFYSPSIGSFDTGVKAEGAFGRQTFGLLDVRGPGFDDSAFGFAHVLPSKSFGYSVDVVKAHHLDGNRTASSAAGDDIAYQAVANGRDDRTGFGYTGEYAAENGTARGTTARLAYKSEDYAEVRKPNYTVNLRYTAIGPTWGPLDGFTNLADLRGPGAYLDLTGNPRHGPFARLEFFGFADRMTDASGAVHQSDSYLSFDAVTRKRVHLAYTTTVSALHLYRDGLDANGFASGYAGGVTVPFDTRTVSAGYADGTPTPTDVSYSIGPYTTYFPSGTVRPTYVRQYTLSTARPLGAHLSAALEFDGTRERFAAGDPLARTDGQTLRRLSLTDAVNRAQSVSLGLRSVSGGGGFGTPGLNLAGAYHARFANGGELFVDYGTPAATTTLQRWIVKYVVKLGAPIGS